LNEKTYEKEGIGNLAVERIYLQIFPNPRIRMQFGERSINGNQAHIHLQTDRAPGMIIKKKKNQ
jgi:hypothetical protein